MSSRVRATALRHAVVAPAEALELDHAMDLTDAGRSAELHIYRRGQHGFGMVKQGAPSDKWIDLFHGWLTDQGFG
jgi:hypothetical protein